MFFNCSKRRLQFLKMMRRGMAVILVLALFVSLFSIPVTVNAEDSTMTITGHINDELGNPVIGNEVYLEFLDPNSNFGRVWAHTDGEGEYSFEPIFIGPDYLIKQFRITVENPGVTGLTSTWTDNFKYGTYPYNFTITRYGTTVVHMIEETGAQVPAGVPMWFSYTAPIYNDDDWPWHSPADRVTPHYTTSEGGNINLQLLASWCYDGVIGEDASSLGGFSYGYAAGQKGYGGIDQTYNMVDNEGVDRTSDLRYELPSDSNLRTEMIDVSTQAGKNRELDFYVRALGKVTAIARDAVTSLPLQGISWNCSSSSGFKKYSNYGDGQFSTYAYGGDTISFTASDPSDPAEGHLGHRAASGEGEATPWGNETITLDLQPISPGIISGRVADLSGNGIQGATVELLWPRSSEEYSIQSDNDEYQPLKSTSTDSDGHYSFTDVVPTDDNYWYRYIIRATKTGLNTDTAENIALDSGEELVMEDLHIGPDSEPPYWDESDGLDAVSVGWSGIVLEWPEASDDTGVTGYKIYCGGTLLADSGYESYYNSLHYTVNNLEPATNYDFKVEAYDEADNVSEPLSVSVTTSADYEPASQVIRASMSSEGLEANYMSRKPAINADGQFIAFESEADNLCNGDINNREDIFLFDRNTGQLKCLSLTASGTTGNGSSLSPDISADGCYVTFASDASNLVNDDTNGSTDIYLYDTATESIEIVSMGLNGQIADGSSSTPSISHDGRYIAFSSSATNLIEDDNNGKYDIFVTDCTDGTTTRVSYQLNGSEIAWNASNPVISDNGLFVVYEIYNTSNYINSIYVYDIENQTTELVTKRYSDPSTAGRGFNPSISADGRYIAFYSGDNGLVNSDTNGKEDIFVYDRVDGDMQLASIHGLDGQGNNYSTYPAISADGRFVAFKSMASNLVSGDTNGCYDVFVRDLVEGATERVSVNAGGTQGDSDSSWEECAPAISADGRFVAFDSDASNLAAGDSNDEIDIFIYDRGYVEGSDPTISSITAVDDVEVPYGTSEQGAIEALPECTTIIDSNGQTHTVNLSWTIANYNGTVLGNYTATGTFTLPAGVAQTDPETVLEVISTLTVSNSAPSGNADLKSLAISAGTLNPAFTPATTSYAVSVSHGVSSIAVTPVTADNNAAFTVNSQSVANGQASQAISLDVGSNTITIRVTAQNGTTKVYTITVSRNSSEDRDSGSSGGSTPEPTGNAILSAGTQNQSLNVSIDKTNSSASVSLSGNALNSAFQVAAPGSDGVKTIKIKMPEVQNTDSYVLKLPAGTLASENAETKIKMETEIGTITLPGNMLEGMGLESTGNVGISIGNADKSKLPQDVRDKLGNKPIVELKLTAGDRTIEWNNPNAPVTVSIPYTPTEAELANPEHITIWYVDGSGNVIEVPSGRYDPVTGTVTFNTTHFSKYAVVYVTKTFEDLGSVPWAEKQIKVLASKGIVKGMTEKEYAPQKNITRADFLYFLVRTLGVDTKGDANFEDISRDAYYYKEIATAKKLGITAGAGNNRFNPSASITRQDMMVLTMRALRIVKKLEPAGKASELNKFADKSQIAAYAVDSTASIVKEGLIAGSGDKINPMGNTTRAEAAVLLYRIYNNY